MDHDIVQIGLRLMVAALVVLDRRPADDTAIDDVTGGVALIDPGSTGSGGATIPMIAVDDAADRSAFAASTWFCPGVPANDGSISGALVLGNRGEEDVAATITHFGSGVEPIEPLSPTPEAPKESLLDYADVRGHAVAKFACEVAAAGRHHMALTGSPGVGKTMLA